MSSAQDLSDQLKGRRMVTVTKFGSRYQIEKDTICSNSSKNGQLRETRNAQNENGHKRKTPRTQIIKPQNPHIYDYIRKKCIRNYVVSSLWRFAFLNVRVYDRLRFGRFAFLAACPKNCKILIKILVTVTNFLKVFIFGEF